MKRRNFLAGMVAAAAVAGCTCNPIAKNEATAVSPDGHNEIRFQLKPFAYEVLRDGQTLVAKTAVGMKIDGACLCQNAMVKDVTTKALSGCVKTDVYKKGKVCLKGQETFIDYGDFGVRLVARNDGVAYRFETKKAGKIKVNCEKAQVTIPDGAATCWVNKTRSFGCEETVNATVAAKDVRTTEKEMVYLPFVYMVAGKTVAVTESDVYDYPIWNLTRGEQATDLTLGSKFANWPKKTERVGGWGKDHNLKEGGRWVRINEHDDFIVETDGTRTFPWRTFILADKPSKLCEADIVYALARPACPKKDFSWVKPGKVAWDWWNDWNLDGAKIDFKAGCNTKTYEHYIDFASKTGVEYVIFDEGWSEQLNIWKDSKEVDVDHLIKYANDRNVGIILWMAWAQVYGNEDRIAEYFAKKGAKGFKVDFMDRGDADVERFLWKFADECAKNKMLVDYHFLHLPTGMHRAYPNVINYEGIHGLEQMKWFKNKYDMMASDVKSFFVRLTAGPMDYTPGAMLNFPIGQYTGNNHNPGPVGTRGRQMAMMAMYEAPLQMLCDSPAKYEANMECFKFMAATPVVWDDTVGLGGCPDTMAAVARKAKCGAWYAAGITNAEARDFDLCTKFLGAGEWTAEIFRDAPNADVEPAKYVHETKVVKAGDKFAVHMAPGGGFVVKFTKK